MARDENTQNEIETILYTAYGGFRTGEISLEIYEQFVKPLEEQIESLKSKIWEMKQYVSFDDGEVKW